MSVVRAIDVGYGQTKYTLGRNDRREILVQAFPSLAAPATGKSLDMEPHISEVRDRNIVPVNGTDYEVGHAVEVMRVLDEKFIEKDVHIALIRGALKLMEIPEIDLLVLGTPVSYYDAKAPFIRKSFTGQHNLGDGKAIEVHRVVCLPQPIGGFVWYGESNNSYQQLRQQTNLIIDVGYFTLDWLVTRGAAPITGRSGSVPFGVAVIINLLTDVISHDLGTDVRCNPRVCEAVDQALYGKKQPILNGRPYDISRHTKHIAGRLEQGVTLLSARVGNAVDIDNIILIGGAAKHYAPLLRKQFPSHPLRTIDQAQFANVFGYQVIGEGLVQKDTDKAST